LQKHNANKNLECGNITDARYVGGPVHLLESSGFVGSALENWRQAEKLPE
jgi:hypothetical protein